MVEMEVPKARVKISTEKWKRFKPSDYREETNTLLSFSIFMMGLAWISHGIEWHKTGQWTLIIGMSILGMTATLMNISYNKYVKEEN